MSGKYEQEIKKYVVHRDECESDRVVSAYTAGKILGKADAEIADLKRDWSACATNVEAWIGKYEETAAELADLRAKLDKLAGVVQPVYEFTDEDEIFQCKDCHGRGRSGLGENFDRVKHAPSCPVTIAREVKG